MPFDISDFLSVIDAKGGVQRPSKFMVRINMPAGLTGTPTSQQDKATVRYLEYYAESVSVPLIGLQTYKAARYGYGAQESRPHNPLFMDLQINFISDDAAKNYSFFYDWINMIYNFKMTNQSGSPQNVTDKTGHINFMGVGPVMEYQPYELAYRAEYLTDLEIQTFTQTGQQNQSLIFRECFPTTISGQDLAWADVGGSYVRLPVSFTYTDMYLGPILDQQNVTTQTPAFPPLK